MAKQVVFSVDLDVSTAESKIQEFLKSTDDAKEKLRELSKAARDASVAGNDALANTFAKAAGEVKDAMGDANASINNFASDTRKLDIAVGAVQGLAGAFATVQGTIGLFAEDNEKLQKTLTKVQSSLAVLNGVQQVAQTLNKESAVGAALYAASNNILSSSIFKTNTALKGLRAALLASGIGAIVVLVGALIANFEKLTDLIGGVNSQEKDLLKTQQKQAELSQQAVDNVSEEENILKLQGKSQKDILKIKAKALETAIKDQEVVIATSRAQLKSQIEAAQRNKDILVGILNFISAPLRLVLKTVDAVGEALGQDFGLEKMLDQGINSIAELVFDPKQVAEEGEKTLQESEKVLRKLKNDYAGTQLAIQQIDKEAGEKASKQREEQQKKDDENRKANEERRLNAIADEQQRQLALFDFNRQEQRKAAEKAGQDLLLFDAETARERADLLKQQEEKRKQDQAKADADALAAKKEAFDKELQALKDKNAQEILEAGGKDKLKLDQLMAQAAAEKAILDQQLANGLITQEAYNLRIAELEADLTAKKKAELEQRKADQKALEDFAVNGALSALSTISTLNDAFAAKDEKNAKKAFENNKKLQIAETLIQTYAGAAAAFAQAQKNPISIIGPAYPFIQAGLAVAAGLAQVAKIKAQQFRGGNSGGGGAPPAAGGGASAPVAPSAFTGQQASSVVAPAGVRAATPQPQRVFVVESDITSTQDRVKVLETNSNAKF